MLQNMQKNGLLKWSIDKLNSMITEPEKNNLYPIFLKLEDLELLLVGAGNVGLEKLQSFLTNSPDARITVVAPGVNKKISALLTQYPNCRIIKRMFEENDLDGKDLVILATDDHALHQQIKLMADSRGILVNVADTPELCDFYLGSIVQKGNLKIAISTNGKSPTLAKRIKEVLYDAIPEEIDELLIHLNKIRSNMKEDFGEKVKILNDLTKSLTGK